tara:strand:+ start:1159 stop:2001 length:843 start_codon:yes stop_codon:yes gene_type:complete
MIFWLASYPKSGNTWIRTFISTYYFTNSDTFEFKYLKNIKQFPHEKFFNKDIKDINSAINSWDQVQKNINIQNKIIFLKTHSALATINNCAFTSKEHSIAGIYIVRDPRNVITSLSNHYQLNFDQSLEFMTNSKKFLLNKKNINNFANFTFLSSWSEHYKSWINNKQFKIFFLKYEDLEINPSQVFKEMILFINKVLNKNDKIDMNKVKKIIESISFEKLKKKEKENGFPEAVKDKSKKKINFFNLGKKNKWNEILTNHQINLLNKNFKNDLNILKYKIK